MSIAEGYNPVEAAPIKEIDLGSIPRKLVRLRITDYAMVFFGGPIFIGAFIGPLLTTKVPTIWDLDAALICGLCLRVGYRNFGVLRPSNWVDYAFVLPLPVIFTALTVYYLVQSISLSEDILRLTFLLGLLAAGALVGFPTALQLIRARVDAVGARLSVWLARDNNQGVGRPIVAKVPVVNTRRGVVLAVCGIAVLAGNIIVPTLLPANVAHSLDSAGQFIYFLGFGFLMRARRYFQVGADALLAADHRNPILLLRSFEDDEKARFGLGDRQLLDFSIETRLASHFMQYGPFIAVGSPLDPVPQIGAARARLADDQWQSAVLGWMNTSAAVLMLAGKTKWVTWELGRLVEGRHVQKMILLLPVRSFRRARRHSDALARLENVRSAFSGTPWETALGRIERPETVRAMTFGTGGAITLIRAKSASRDAYHMAALLAHDLMLSPAGSAAAAESEPARPPHGKVLIAAAIALLTLVPAFNPGLLAPLCERSAVVCKLAGLPVASAKIAAALRASQELLTLAKPDDPPRISDPAVKRLLTRIFDTSVLNDNSAAPSLPEIAHWFDAIQATYSLYLLRDTEMGNVGEAIQKFGAKPGLEAKMAANAAAYQVEIGRSLDAQMAVLGRLAQLVAAQFGPAAGGNEQMRNALATVRGPVVINVAVDLWSIYVPAVSDDWRRQRFEALLPSAPAAARLLADEQRRALANLAKDAAEQVTDPTLRDRLVALMPVFDAGVPVPSKIAGALWASQRFLKLAKADALPRISDPAVKALLLRIFDTSVLNDNSAAPSLQEIAHWFDAIQGTYSLYLLHDTQTSTIGEAIQKVGDKPGLEEKMAANVAAYQEEIGLGLDAQMPVLRTLAEMAVAQFVTAAPENEQTRKTLTILRGAVLANLIIDVWSIYTAPASDDWRRQRLAALAPSAPAAARLLLGEQRQVLKNLTKEAAHQVKDQTVSDGLSGLMQVLGAAP